MSLLTFVVVGGEAGRASQRFEAVLAAAAPGFEVTRSAPSDLPVETRKAVDLIAVATLILSVPPAILATLDVIDRIEKRRRAQQLIDEAKRLKAETGADVRVMGNGEARPLDGLTPDVLLDIARML